MLEEQGRRASLSDPRNARDRGAAPAATEIEQDQRSPVALAALLLADCCGGVITEAAALIQLGLSETTRFRSTPTDGPISGAWFELGGADRDAPPALACGVRARYRGGQTRGEPGGWDFAPARGGARWELDLIRRLVQAWLGNAPGRCGRCASDWCAPRGAVGPVLGRRGVACAAVCGVTGGC
jgi:hypothetical protein